MIFHVMLEEAEDGWIVVECPALPGCVSQGRGERSLGKHQRSDYSVVMGRGYESYVSFFKLESAKFS